MRVDLMHVGVMEMNDNVAVGRYVVLDEKRQSQIAFWDDESRRCWNLEYERKK